MFDGSTGGRAFESALAPALFTGILAVTAVAWVWFEYDIRRRRRRDDAPPPREDDSQTRPPDEGDAP